MCILILRPHFTAVHLGTWAMILLVVVDSIHTSTTFFTVVDLCIDLRLVITYTPSSYACKLYLTTFPWRESEETR